MSINNQKLKYILLGFIFWFIVDWATAGGLTLAYLNVPFIAHLVRFIIFLVPPILFAYLIFNQQWNNQRLFLITLVVLLIVELPISRNRLLYIFPNLIIFIPLAIAIYSLLAFFPLWIVKNEIGENKWKIIFLSFILIAATGLSMVAQRR